MDDGCGWRRQCDLLGHDLRPGWCLGTGQLRRVQWSTVRTADVRVRQDHPEPDDEQSEAQGRQGADHRWRHCQLHQRGCDLQRYYHGTARVPAAADRAQRLDLRPSRRSQLPGRFAQDARNRQHSGHPALRVWSGNPHDRHLRHGPRPQGHPQELQRALCHRKLFAPRRTASGGRRQEGLRCGKQQ
uniref:(northern house mosquito) hypothetical protein n=1 Tax=Culex pipiens TaxID=7175 RepID=A0A8D8G4N9_CULPI